MLKRVCVILIQLLTLFQQVLFFHPIIIFPSNCFPFLKTKTKTKKVESKSESEIIQHPFFQKCYHNRLVLGSIWSISRLSKPNARFWSSIHSEINISYVNSACRWFYGILSGSLHLSLFLYPQSYTNIFKSPLSAMCYSGTRNPIMMSTELYGIFLVVET